MRSATCFVVFAAWLAFSGCSSTDQAENDAADGQAVVRTSTDGPVTVTLTASPQAVEVGKHATVTVEVSAPRGVTVNVEDYRRLLLDGDRRFELGVKELAKKEAVAADGDRLVWRYRYDVSFFLAGTFEFPPATVHFVDTRNEHPASGDADDGSTSSSDAAGDQALQATDAQEERTLATDPITITAADPSTAALDEADLHNIQVLDPVELPRPLSRWVWIGPIIGLLVVLLAIVLIRRKRKIVAERTVVIPAHEWAWQQIARLIADDLVEAGRVQEFYYRVSGIVRGYIERRFGVSAPEMTTEEFLHAAAADPRFDVEHRDGMGRFLQACDLVKYARHVPETGEADGLLAAARTFVEQTREHRAIETHRESDAYNTEERAA